MAVVEGVYSVNIYGATPQEWEIIYDQEKLAAIGVSSSAIGSSIDNYLLEKEIGGATETLEGGLSKRTYLTLSGNSKDTFRWDDIPVAKASGRIIHLTDVAHVKLTEQQPQNYYRINGLNTVNLTVSAGKNVNNIKVADEVKKEIEKIKERAASWLQHQNIA